MKTSTLFALFATISVAFTAPFPGKQGARKGNSVSFGSLNTLIAGVKASTETLTSSIGDLRTAKGDAPKIQYLVPRINDCLDDITNALAVFGGFPKGQGSHPGKGSNSTHKFDHRGPGQHNGNQGRWGSVAIGDLTAGLELSSQLMVSISEALNSVRSLGPDIIGSKSWDEMCDRADGVFESLGLDLGTLAGDFLDADGDKHGKSKGGILGNLLGGEKGLLGGILH
ncbi:hypothetical protein MCOR27_006337 [Pyricularia oryzae]|uniref:Cell wall protein n=2 Tax=Pyricularia TaxID=48558 RepID=A0ABQ8P0Q3_PYRGI|nr:hypothetical protein MCOR02_005809 [Pyricularia oryzae]KAI6304621.1 hypothetical protein MCOR33_000471 [Pyricularia grisea]KAI6260187.1 hypothetical protein MCOR19_003502 [Pyricularia oryzae]KAI6276730.1 hypothetical protein MCOR27_006337 [Pyricularia oryzae]KAI6281672.1 hypothetical protein MCOR26_003177 [Pyricularia oryzae]